MRLGYSWPMGGGQRMWVSTPLLAWLIVWMIAAPFVLTWWCIKLIIWIIKGIIWLVQQAHDAPAVPERLRTPPKR